MIRKHQMTLEHRIVAFAQLGEFLAQFSTNGISKSSEIEDRDKHVQSFQDALKQAQLQNPWFTEANILYSIKTWSELLSKDNLEQWIKHYDLPLSNNKTVAIVMAGNIPLVGFHDFLSVLITGHKVLIKQSSNDTILLNAIVSYLKHKNPGFERAIQFADGQLSGFDAVIATGSNNTARYFDSYFGKYPNIIRKNRNSIAVLQGDESQKQLEALSDDIFRYYGLGCRNVSKLYVPEDYNFDRFFSAIYKWHPIIHEHKYANNYDYNKAVYLMSEFDMLDNGFLVLKQDKSLGSPIATLNFEYYSSLDQLKHQLSELQPNIQCVVANGFVESEVKFGRTQKPELNSYADGIDTVEFLLTI